MSRAPLVLKGKTAVVTGAGSGIGRALAMRAAGEGMIVAACDIDAPALKETEELLRNTGTEPYTIGLDITDDDEIQIFARHIREILPPIGILFANAGILRKGSVLETSIADWRKLFDVNVLGTVQVLKAFAQNMIAANRPAQIVITGSTGTMTSYSGLDAYCATKHALWPIADGLRAELDGALIGVSLLMPGSVATAIFSQSEPDRPLPPDSISPDAAAEIAFSGALADHPLILTHPNFVERAEIRFAGAIRALRS